MPDISERIAPVLSLAAAGSAAALLILTLAPAGVPAGPKVLYATFAILTILLSCWLLTFVLQDRWRITRTEVVAALLAGVGWLFGAYVVLALRSLSSMP